MKKVIALTSLLFVSSYIFSQEIHQAEYFSLNSTVSGNQIFEATSKIELLPGFSYTPQNYDSFIARINPGLIFQPVIGTTGGPNVGDNGVVGSINGTYNVSSIGAAQYSIPVDLPPGIAGLQPNISIEYNSQMGDGILGWGWSISGLSKISRVGSNLYNDGKITGVNYSTNDRFVIDGNRLISTGAGIYGGSNTNYRTEIEDFSSITSLNSSALGPESFEVKTKNGLIMRYGNTADSRIEPSGSINYYFTWLLSEIVDQKGNYIKFSYFEDNFTGEYQILSIEYTGNKKTSPNILPFAKILFNYDTKDIVQVNYLNGNKLTQSKILNSIEVSYNSNVYRKYSFEYTNDGISYKLNKVKLINGNIIAINPIIIQNNTSTQMVTESTPAINYSPDFDYSFGDFNGDGLTDYIITPKKVINQTYYNWSIFLNSKNGFTTTPTYSENVPTTFQKTEGYLDFWHCYHPPITYSNSILWRDQILDFNGDGKCDWLLVSKLDEGTTHVIRYASYYYNESENKIKPVGFEVWVPQDHVNYEVYPVDVNGDQLTDFLIFDTDDATYPIKIRTSCKTSDCVTYKDYLFDNICSWNKNSEVDFGDFNGDGKTDWMIRNTGSTRIFTFDGTYIMPFYSSLNTNQFPSYGDKLYATDFNGDGLTDILSEKFTPASPSVPPYEDIYNYSLKLFTGGVSFVTEEFPIPVVYKWPLLIGDINNDGKTDIVEIDHSQVPPIYKSFYSTGLSFIESQGVPISIPPDFMKNTYGDFNGDGNIDLYFIGGKILNINKDDKSHFVQSITNSLNSTLTFSYEPLTNKNIYTRTSAQSETFPLPANYSYPNVHNIQPALYVVANVKKEDGIGGNNNLSFSYNGARVHTEGRGFLGFRQIESYAQESYAVERTTTSLNFNFYYPYISKQEKTIRINTTDHKISETNNSYTFEDFGNKRIFPHLSSSLIYEWDPNNVFIRTLKKTISYNSVDVLYGNITTAKTFSDEDNLPSSTPEASFRFSSSIDYTYEPPDLTNWIINRVKSETTKNNCTDSWCTELLNTTQYEYYTLTQPDYPLLKKKYNYAQNSLSEKNMVVDEYFYDMAGNIVKKILSAPNATDPPVNMRTMLYEYANTYNYRFLTKVDNGVYITENQYYPESGLVKEAKDANNLVTKYYYDPFNRLEKQTLPDGKNVVTVLRWKTSETNLPTGTLYYTWSKTSGTPAITSYYDKLGRVIGVKSLAFDNSDIVVEKAYDNLGRLKYQYEPNDKTKYTENKYNDFGQLSQIVNPDNSSLIFTYIGRTTKTKDDLHPEQAQTVNALGNLEESKDSKGQSVIYEYFADGQLYHTKLMGITGSDIYNIFDPITRKQTRITDPDAGQIDYTYDAFGELIKQSQIQSVTKTVDYTFKYDNLGRTTEKTNIEEGTTKTYYDTKPNGKGLIAKVENTTSGQSMEYEYDALSRVSKQKEIIDGVTYVTLVEYDNFGRICKTDYPFIDGTAPVLTVSQQYNSNGFLVSITNESTQNKLWRLTEMNNKGQIKKYALGNGLETQQEYYALTGLPYTTKTFNGTNRIQDLEYSWDNLGNLSYRKKWLDLAHTQYLNEEFYYDELNRLDITKLNGVQTSDMNYLPTGNIQSKTGLGLYTYAEDGAGIHALTSVENASGLVSTDQQIINYTPFNKIKHISQGSVKTLDIWYGLEQQRLKQTSLISGVITTKIYVDGMLERVNGVSGNNDYYFISAPTGICAVYVRPTTGAAYTRYIHTDHLGSINCITNETGQLMQENSFDAWGNRRDPLTWQPATTTLPALFCDRGFTGHEHLDAFGLINMNGRVYDPILGRMLSPDNYIQLPENSQNYNRYSYCLNNPLIYTDPSGDFIITLLATFAGAYWGGVQSNNFEWNPGNWDFNNPNTYINIIKGGLAGYSYGDGVEQTIKNNKKYRNESRLFFKSCQDAGIDPFDPVSDISDKFLNEYTDKWYPGSPKGLTDKFTVEQTPNDYFHSKDLTGKEGGATDPIYMTNSKGNEVFSGRSNVYFNKDIAFRSYRELHRTIGHELVHVSQIGALKGYRASLMKQPFFKEMLEFHAYKFRSTPGMQYVWQQEEYSNRYPILYQKLAYHNFLWTLNAPDFPF